MTAPPDVKWRAGCELGRTLYIGETCVGMVDTAEIAAAIVEAMNARCTCRYPHTGGSVIVSDQQCPRHGKEEVR
jgi:hypothetical protein